MIILSLISLLQVLNLSKHQIGLASACHADLGCPAAFIARISAPLEEMSASNLHSSCYQVKVTTALHWKGQDLRRTFSACHSRSWTGYDMHHNRAKIEFISLHIFAYCTYSTGRFSSASICSAAPSADTISFSPTNCTWPRWKRMLRRQLAECVPNCSKTSNSLTNVNIYLSLYLFAASTVRLTPCLSNYSFGLHRGHAIIGRSSGGLRRRLKSLNMRVYLQKWSTKALFNFFRLPRQYDMVSWVHKKLYKLLPPIFQFISFRRRTQVHQFGSGNWTAFAKNTWQQIITPLET